MGGEEKLGMSPIVEYIYHLNILISKISNSITDLSIVSSESQQSKYLYSSVHFHDKTLTQKERQ